MTTYIKVDTEKLNKWKKLDKLLNDKSIDDRAVCPYCRDQLLFCDCIGQAADEVLQSAEVIRGDTNDESDQD